MCAVAEISCIPAPTSIPAQWLLANGARFPKIMWPARTTVGGVRGTVALEDIAVCGHF